MFVPHFGPNSCLFVVGKRTDPNFVFSFISDQGIQAQTLLSQGEFGEGGFEADIEAKQKFLGSEEALSLITEP